MLYVMLRPKYGIARHLELRDPVERVQHMQETSLGQSGVILLLLPLWVLGSVEYRTTHDVCCCSCCCCMGQGFF